MIDKREKRAGERMKEVIDIRKKREGYGEGESQRENERREREGGGEESVLDFCKI